MSRKEELLDLLKDLDDAKKSVAANLIDEMIFLEEQISETKKYPFISVNPKNLAQQKITSSGKLYKELLQQYTNIVRVLCSMTRQVDGEEESPLRIYLKTLKDTK